MKIVHNLIHSKRSCNLCLLVFPTNKSFFPSKILSLDVTACDIDLTVTDTKQYVATEGYPDNYKNNQDCRFHFEAPSGRRIVVLFEDFNLETGYDYLHFRKLYNMSKINLLVWRPPGVMDMMRRNVYIAYHHKSILD